MTDRKLYVRAAEVPIEVRYFTPGRLYEFTPKLADLRVGYIRADDGCAHTVLTDRHFQQCAFLRGTNIAGKRNTARWEIVDADGNPVTPETEE